MAAGSHISFSLLPPPETGFSSRILITLQPSGGEVAFSFSHRLPMDRVGSWGGVRLLLAWGLQVPHQKGLTSKALSSDSWSSRAVACVSSAESWERKQIPAREEGLQGWEGRLFRCRGPSDLSKQRRLLGELRAWGLARRGERLAEHWALRGQDGEEEGPEPLTPHWPHGSLIDLQVARVTRAEMRSTCSDRVLEGSLQQHRWVREGEQRPPGERVPVQRLNPELRVKLSAPVRWVFHAPCRWGPGKEPFSLLSGFHMPLGSLPAFS